jgi:hypothetical protein
VIEILKEDLPVWYFAKCCVGYGFQDNLKGFRPGFATRYSFYGGGVKYWWIEKS